MCGSEFKARFWRPVFSKGGNHHIGVFSHEELRPLGGGAGLVNELSKQKLQVSLVPIPVNLRVAPDAIAVKHQFNGEQVHKAYSQLKLHKESMVIPS